ncbi:MAG: PHP domain-containing protein [Cyanobacteria bacterium J06642_3]
MLELHCHTTYSDGKLTPTELVYKALLCGVQALAITDHDTLGGWDEAIAAAEPLDLEIIPGVELSTVYNGRSLHILGFYPQESLLKEPLQERLEGRKRRAAKMVANLREMGYALELPALEGNMALGRPHIAHAMLKAGYVRSMKEAFARFIGEDKPAYVHYEKFSSQEGIELIKACKGIPVWAHPYLFRGGKVEEVLPELVEAGLMGIEVYHPDCSPSQQQKLLEHCQHYGLLATGGTDYHGEIAGKKKTKNQLNHFQLPLTMLDSLKGAINI